MKVLVTGASGFLGAQIVRAVDARGHEAIALLRRSSSRARLPHGASIREASLDDDDALYQACLGIDTVVHAAGGGRVSAGVDMRERNVLLTQNVIAAAQRASVNSFLFVSSLAAKAARSQYGRSKKAAEDALFANEGLRTLVVRPSAIYGPGDDRWLSYFKAANARIAVHPKVKALRMIHVDDCAEFIALALEKLASDATLDKGAFDICDGQSYTWNDVSKAVGAALHKRVYAITLSQTLLNVVTDVSTVVARIRRRSAFLSRDKTIDACTAHESESHLAHRRFEWTARYTLAEGMCHALAGYREAGDL